MPQGPAPCRFHGDTLFVKRPLNYDSFTLGPLSALVKFQDPCNGRMDSNFLWRAGETDSRDGQTLSNVQASQSCSGRGLAGGSTENLLRAKCAKPSLTLILEAGPILFVFMEEKI